MLGLPPDYNPNDMINKITFVLVGADFIAEVAEFHQHADIERDYINVFWPRDGQISDFEWGTCAKVTYLKNVYCHSDFGLCCYIGGYLGSQELHIKWKEK